jgi:hypothetical protein
MFTLFDTHELRARVVPSVIVLLPLLSTLFFCFPQGEKSWPAFVSQGVVSLACLYALTFVIRAKGRAIETKLWHSWGGVPSTRILRWRDNTLSKETKKQIQELVLSMWGVQLLPESAEKTDPVRADRLIVDTFSQIKEFLRLQDKEGLWLKQNAEYGFARNLLANRDLYVLFCAFGILACILCAQHARRPIVNVGTGMNLLFLMVGALVGWRFLPSVTKETADRYAERAWLTFLLLAGRPGADTRK